MPAKACKNPKPSRPNIVTSLKDIDADTKLNVIAVPELKVQAKVALKKLVLDNMEGIFKRINVLSDKTQRYNYELNYVFTVLFWLYLPFTGSELWSFLVDEMKLPVKVEGNFSNPREFFVNQIDLIREHNTVKDLLTRPILPWVK